MSPTEPSPGRSTPSYSCWATAMVHLEEKPSLREASCCRVEVMNGGAALRLRSLLLTSATVQVAGLDGLFSLGGQVGLEAPVLAGLEGVDLTLAVDDHLERGRLDPAGGEPGPDPAPQHRRPLLADTPGAHPAG